MKARDMNRNPRGRATAINLRKHIALGGNAHDGATFGCEPLSSMCETPPREEPGLDHTAADEPGDGTSDSSEKSD